MPEPVPEPTVTMGDDDVDPLDTTNEGYEEDNAKRLADIKAIEEADRASPTNNLASDLLNSSDPTIIKNLCLDDPVLAEKIIDKLKELEDIMKKSMKDINDIEIALKEAQKNIQEKEPPDYDKEFGKRLHKSLFERMPEKLRNVLKKVVERLRIKKRSPTDSPEDIKAGMDDAESVLNDPEVVEETNKAKTEEEKINTEELKEGKSKSKWSVKNVLKLLMLLAIFGSAIFSIVLVCIEFTGCYQYTNNSNKETNKKVLCNVSDKVGFTNVQCNCSKNTETSDCNSKDSVPSPVDKGNTPCKNENSLQAPYVYYTYKIFTPADLLTHVLQEAANLAGKGVSGILATLEKVGIVIVVVIFSGVLLLSIVKYLAKKGFSTQLNITK